MPEQPAVHGDAWSSELLVFAAATRPALAAQVRAFADHVAAADRQGQPLAAEALRCAEAAGQAPGAHRLALIADSRQDAAVRLTRALQHLDDPQRARFNLANRVFYETGEDDPAAAAQRTALLFPGFGAWHPSLVADLDRHFASVHTWIAGLEPETRRSITDNPHLFPYAANATASQDPAMAFAALMGAVLAGDLALYKVLHEVCGLQAGALVGHSYGENAMLLASGMVDDYRFIAGLVRRLTAAMGRVYQSRRATITDGALLALPAAAYAALDPAARDAVHLALDNCPQQVVVFGAPAAIDAIAAQMQAQGVAAFRLPTLDQPVHTPRFPIAPADLRAVYAGLAIAAPQGRATAYSCTTAAPFPRAPEAVRDLLSAQWHQPVRFRETIAQLAADGVRTFVEVGPGGRLTGFVRDILLRGAGQETGSADILAVAANLESRATIFQLQACLAQLFVRGHALDLRRLVTDRRAQDEAASPAPAIPRPAVTPGETGAPPGASRRQQQALLDEILALTAAALELTDAALDPDLGFFDLGLGSLQAVELVARLAQQLDLPLAQTLAFDYPTPRTLAHHLYGLLHPEEAGEGVSAAAPQPAPGSAVAIVGMGCRFPGGVDSPAAFWDLLKHGRDAIVERPAGRWPEGIAAWLESADEAARIRFGGYLDEIETFDAAFFGITPREAETLDPQQRLLLEVVWAALEDAAINPRDLAGTAAGVFVGISHADYALRLTPAARLAISSYLATGNTASTAAGRIAFLLGLTGPCLAVDTACSSSLVALHLACQSLRQGECDVALVGGVNLLVAPESSIFLSKAAALAVDGRCKTFDARADGYVRGEGCGVVVLKRLADAQAAGDNILAVVRGSAVNHDGRTSGLTVPSGPAQQRVIRRGLAAAGVAPDEVDFVECHGTGTSLGDPIEVQALGQVFGQGARRRTPLLLGSVKTNLGHLEAAAGIAGLMKLVLQLQHSALAPNLHFQTPNPKVDWARLPLRVCTELAPWPAAGDERPRIGGVSSFGISGTNAHVVLQAPAAQSAPAVEPAAGAPQVLTLSARTPAALAALSARYLERLTTAECPPWTDLCYTSNAGRAHFEVRRGIVATTPAEAAEQLRERPAAATVRARPVIAFLCSGQGSQYPGMAQRLFATEPIFRAALEACDAGLRPHLERSLLDVIFEEGRGAKGEVPLPPSPLLHQTAYTQPALFAVEYALARLWQAWGVQPDYLLGHSIGEYTAACLAGVFSFEDALRLVAARGRLMQSLPAGGAMLAAAAAPAQVEALLAAGTYATLALAAVNGPASVVLSGALAEVEHAAAALAGAGVRTSRLTVSHAFHSPLMEPILAEFAAVAATVAYAPPQIPLVTNRTGGLAGSTDAAQIATAAYWVRQLREPVHFAQGLQTLIDKGCSVLLEIGPKPVLIGMGQQAQAAAAHADSLLWLASLQPPQDDQQQMLVSLAALYARGGEIDWRGFHRSRAGQPAPRRRGGLPAYPFQRERFWIDAPASLQESGAAGAARDPGLPILGEPVDLPGAAGQLRFEYRPTAAERALFAAYLDAGQPGRRARLPLAGLLTLLHSAGRACFPAGALRITETVLHRPPPWKLGAAGVVQTVLTPRAEGGYGCAVYSRRQSGAAWTLLATAAIAQEENPAALPAPAPAPAAIPPEQFYAASRQLGFTYGAAFQVLQTLAVGGQSAAARLAPPPDELAARLPDLAPMLLLDGAFQALGAVLFQPDAPGLYAVARIDAITFWPARWPARLDAAVTCGWPPATTGPEQIAAAIALRDPESGAAVAQVAGIRFARAAADDEEGAAADAQPAAAADVAATRPEPLQDLLDTAPEEHRRLVTRRVRKMMANIVGIPRDRPIDEEGPFHQLGVDSLLALRLRNAVQADYRVDIPLARFVTDLGVTTLAAAILAQVDLLAAAEPPAADLLSTAAWVEGEL